MSTTDVDISILLEGSQEIYHSGETVRGVVALRINKFVRVAVVKAELEGVYIYRYKTHSGYHKQQIVFAEVKLAINGKVSDIDPGHYSCPFSFTLDSLLPSSLACFAGSVEYKIVAKCGYKLTNTSRITKAETMTYFSVNRYVDLKDNPLLAVGAQAQHFIKPPIWLMCCCQELFVTMKTKKRGFVAGEKIEVSASIDNGTSRIISNTELDVLQVINTRLNYSVKQVVVRKERGMVMNYSNRVWLNEYLLIPSVPPTSDDRNMTVSYLLRMLLTMDNGKRIKLKIPIVIGNIPVDTSIIEGAGSELSFMYKGEINGGGDVVQSYIPRYIVYRCSSGTSCTSDAVPPAPSLEEPTP